MTNRSAVSNRLAILVCALGYFIDVFDIQLFAVVRVPSLTAIGVPADKLAAVSGNILNIQMLGMILGAFLWGWLGDRYGRIKSLYGSILIYSLGTLACGFVQHPTTYALLRFITAFGLAGEVGAAVVLISELMPAEKRGWAITILGAIGFLGPVFAVLASFVLSWQQNYFFAGIMGLILLALRCKLIEPDLFQKLKHDQSLKDFIRVLARPSSLRTFTLCLIMSLPLCYAWNVLNFFSMEISSAVLVAGQHFDQKTCLLAFFIGTSIGDVISGVITQVWKSRRKAMVATLLLGLLGSLVLLIGGHTIKFSALNLYAIYFILGLASGCWALATMITAEHFGTNIRATTSLIMLNFLRGFTIPMVLCFQSLREPMGITNAALLIGLILYPMSFIAIRHLQETHGRDLDYVEAPGN